MGTLLNSEGPDDSTGSALFAKSKKDCTILLEIINYITLIYTMDNPDLTVSNFMGNSIGLKGLKMKIDKLF